MTDNYPPEPPEPEKPEGQPFQAPGQFPGGPPPQYNQAPPGYGQPPYVPQQPFAQAPYGQQPQFAPQAYGQAVPQQWQYPYQGQPAWAAPLPPKSGIRTAAGVVTVVMGAWMFVTAVAGLGFGMLLLALAALTAGILVLALRRSKGVQVFALVCSGVAVLGALLGLGARSGVVAPLMLLSLAGAATVLTSMSVARERRGA